MFKVISTLFLLSCVSAVQLVSRTSIQCSTQTMVMFGAKDACMIAAGIFDGVIEADVKK